MCALTASFSLNAAVGDKITKNGMIFTVLSETTPTVSVQVQSTTAISGALSIPSTVTNGSTTYSVTSITTMGFKGCNTITSVTIPSTVTVINTYAFQSCATLKSVSIPASATAIGMGSFSECPQLVNITIDANNPNYVSVDNCILNKAQTNLLQYSTGTTGSYTIPPTVTEITQSAFSGTSLSSVNMPASVATIGNAAFAKSKTLESINVDVENPTFCSVDGVLMNHDQTLLIQYPGGKKGFYAIPSTVTALKVSCFEGCAELTAVEFPSSITTIPEWTFGTCTKLTSIVIPASVTSIGLRAFTGCTNLTKIYDTNPTPQTLGEYAFASVPTNAEIFVPAGSKSAYSSASGWSSFSNFTEIKMTGESFTEDGLVYTITNIERPQVSVKAQSANISGDVVIPERAIHQDIYYAVTKIEDQGFANCTNITSVEIPSTVAAIGNEAFKDCSSIEKITNLSPTPQSLGADAFSGIPATAELFVEEGCESAFEAAAGWNQFTDVNELRALEIALSEAEATIAVGKTVDLTTDITKTFDVEITSQTWTSSNPEVATVNQDGVVTGIAPGSATITYSAVDNYNRTTSAICLVEVTEVATITQINTDLFPAIDFSKPFEVFTLSGQKINRSIGEIASGIYIIRQGNGSVKMIID